MNLFEDDDANYAVNTFLEVVFQTYEFPCGMNIDCKDFPSMSQCGWFVINNEEGADRVCIPREMCDTTVIWNTTSVEVHCEDYEY